MFNDTDLAVLRILGETPSFKRIISRSFDTPIVMTKTSKKATVTNAQMCRAEVVGEADLLTKAINTGDFKSVQATVIIVVIHMCKVEFSKPLIFFIFWQVVEQ